MLQSVHSASGSGSEHEDGGKSSTAIQPLRSPPASSRSGSAKSGSVSGSDYSEYSEYGSGSGSGTVLRVDEEQRRAAADEAW